MSRLLIAQLLDALVMKKGVYIYTCPGCGYEEIKSLGISNRFSLVQHRGTCQSCEFQHPSKGGL